MAYLATVSADDLNQPRILDFRLEHTGRLDGLGIMTREAVMFALGKYLQVRGYGVSDDPRDRFKYVVTDEDLDKVLSMFKTDIDNYFS